MTLPYAAQGAGYSVVWQDSFGGLDERLGAPEGAIAAMENMTGDHWPVMSPRGKRRRYKTLGAPYGLGGADKLYWVDDTQFYYDGEAKGAVAAGEKRFCCLGSYIVIWPDKCYYNTKTGEFGALEARVTASGCELRSEPSPSGLSTERNCLYLPGVDAAALFAPEEAVRISGCDKAANDKTLVIREVSGSCLYFYDESFSMTAAVRYVVENTLAAGSYYFEDPLDGDYYSFEITGAIDIGCRLVRVADTVTLRVESAQGSEVDTITAEPGRWPEAAELVFAEYCPAQEQSAAVTVAREIPALEHMCQCSNRLWGVHGNTVCCSYLGNPKVWNNFDTTATACWSVEVGSPGAFTAACAYGGYPLLFKADRIYRVYGTKSANFQLFETETLGVEPGSAKSLAVVGQTLYYKSRAGFVAYAGGVPRRIDTALGTARRQDAVAGTDGRKYYVSCLCGDEWSLLVYDGQTGLWHREDDSRALDIAWCGGELFLLGPDGGVWMIGSVQSADGTEEDAVESGCEFAPVRGDGGSRTAAVRLYLRVSVGERLTVEVEYDGSGVWETAAIFDGGERRVKTVELVPRRCGELRIRLRGRGEWKLWALGRESQTGSRMEG